MERLHHTMITESTPLDQNDCRFYMNVEQVLLIGNTDFDNYLKTIDGFDLRWYIENPEYSVIEILGENFEL